MLKKILLLIIFCLFPVQIFANSAELIMDNSSSRIVYESNINEPLLVASTAKIMTAIIVIENGNLEKQVLINKNNLNSYGAGISLVLGEKITRLDLLYGMLLRSGNDAAYALAVDVAGSEQAFAKLMNNKAKELKLKSSNYKNVSGLDDFTKNYVSAYDLAKTYQYALTKSLFREIMLTKNYNTKTNIHNYKFENKNKLLFKYEKTTGGKSGYTSRSGSTLVSSAKRGRTELIIVTINKDDSYNYHLKRYQEYFPKYYSVRVVNHKKYRIKNNKYYNKKRLYIKRDVTYLLTKEEQTKVSRKLIITKKKSKQGRVGYIVVYLDNKIIGKTPVYLRGKK